ncbi:hypothetical protein JD79_03600 [Geodermatophilus normandii]|uniref:HEAT repeat domain-containing protein n=1 Tax=Geodermatophilus normandii TaxID=1137989 RepID=A0A317QNW2_9ACTN|nr:hypothetical protein [Geodermatophilus normandii]PWW24421.1 hypothetical protein JD79_03600 [Geodermatophilus normandii]
MPVTREELRLLLSNEEPDYAALAARLDATDVPAVAELAESDDVMIASKAVYTASLLPGGAEVVQRAAASADPVLQAASASGLRNLAPDRREPVAEMLLGRGDVAVEKVALRALDRSPGPRLAEKLQHLAEASDSDLIRDMSRDVLEGRD